MEKQLGKEYVNKAQRESYLKDNCEKVESKGYMKPFTPEQLQGHKENLAELSIQIEEVEEEKKESAKHFKETLEPLTRQRREMVSNIKQKAEYVNELCYKFIDREERQTGYYNADGDLIELRPATADEMQPTLFIGLPKTGTNE
jgi:septal ring factor EnvC (AmiA/AmiB activator)